MHRLEVICGPMFSEKTTELIRRLRREQIAGRNVVAFKHSLDSRYEADAITSHNGQKIPSYLVEYLWQIPELTNEFDVVGIDEVQFFEPDGENISAITALVQKHKRVIVAGLDMTYRREPFGIMPYLLAVADDVAKLRAVCHKCGEDAQYTQRLIDGEPAPFSGPTVQVGALESYEARCKNCFEKA